MNGLNPSCVKDPSQLDWAVSLPHFPGFVWGAPQGSILGLFSLHCTYSHSTKVEPNSFDMSHFFLQTCHIQDFFFGTFGTLEHSFLSTLTNRLKSRKGFDSAMTLKCFIRSHTIVALRCFEDLRNAGRPISS